ncbi:unnamed protein product [Peronospora belbahrii]|uniref:Uncharacterized protein n=1 Tax=Peronospora belbahrii TaxID=622444 RepID=A0AAU9KYQ2_9STRA|nr:unnamed protein product [Peronospora belbahrii]
MKAPRDELSLAFELPKDEHHHRSDFLALKQVTQVHVFVTEMNAGHQHFYLTRKPLKSLEEAFAIALREDVYVMASRMEYSSPPPATQLPDFMGDARSITPSTLGVLQTPNPRSL